MRPLEGVTVVELSENVAGPYAGEILAQLGADVVKVERPGHGDDTRQWGPPSWEDDGVMFHVMNAGKRSMELDLRDESDRAELFGLIDGADVVLQSWRRGVAERLGLDVGSLRASRPRLICCDISAFGDEGPLRDDPGYDPLIQAFSGLMSITGTPGGPPVRVGTSLIDMGAGIWAALGVLCALLRREVTGAGATVSTSLLEVGLAWLPYQIVGTLITGEDPEPAGTGLPFLVPYQAFPTAEGHLIVAAGNNALWRRLCDVLGREDLGADESLATNPQRVANRDRVVAAIEQALERDDAATWEQRLRAAGVPCGRLQTVGEAAAHEQTAALGMIEPAGGGDPPKLRLPVRMDGERPAAGAGAPPLGEANSLGVGGKKARP